MSVDQLVYTVRELCQALGLSRPTVDELTNRHEHPLPHFYAGRRILYPRCDVARWLSEESSPTPAGAPVSITQAVAGASRRSGGREPY